MKIYKQTLFPILVILYLFASEILSQYIGFFRYSDEIITVISVIYIVYLIIKKKFYLSKELKNIFFLCISLFIIGVISNFANEIQTNLYVISLDIISFMKLFICSFAFYNLLNKDKAIAIATFFEKLAKIFLILGFIFLIITQFIDLGMRGNQRFGLWEFNFIFGYAHVYSSIILFLLTIVYSIEKNKKNIFYLILAIIQMISTTKGPSIIWSISILFLIVYMRKKKKIHFSMLIILGIVSIVFGSYQIKNYLTNIDAPRFLFYKYGAVTANEYFPLGSGFATFGSDMAAENYSKLYTKYGFEKLYGMSRENPAFLNDNYWPMIYGQFGWIGFGISLLIAFNVFMSIQKSKIKGRDKGIIFSIFFYTILHSLGSSILTSSSSIVIYIGIILFIKCNTIEEENIREQKQI